jgi:hypothetical protein
MVKTPYNQSYEQMVKELEKGLVKKKVNKRRKPSSTKGRVKGDKNVTSLGAGSFVNQHGVEFTDAEREAIRQAVNSVKRKKKRILSDTTGKYAGLKTFLTSNDGSLTGILGDFSTSMNQFETREGLENYMKRLDRMRSRGYETELMNRVKENYIKTIEPSFKGRDDAFIEHIKKMPVQEFFARRGSHLTDDFLFMNSEAKDLDDRYMTRLVHSFGWKTLEEQLNGDKAIDPYTGDEIKSGQVKKKQKKAPAKKKGKK